MEEIKFKVNRFRRFIDNVVRAVTFLSFLLFLLSFYIYKYKSGEIYKKQVALCDVVLSQGLTQQNPLENPIHSFFLTSKEQCFANASTAVNYWIRTAFIALDITILLPTVYFGGRKWATDAAGKLVKKNQYIAANTPNE